MRFSTHIISPARFFDSRAIAPSNSSALVGGVRPHQHKATTFKVLHAWCCVHIFIEGEEGGILWGILEHTPPVSRPVLVDLNSMIPSYYNTLKYYLVVEGFIFRCVGKFFFKNCGLNSLFFFCISHFIISDYIISL